MHTNHPRIPCLSLFLAVLLAAAVGGAAQADTFTVEARTNNSFSPSTLNIQVGDTVTFKNVGGGLHNVHTTGGPVSFQCASSCSGSGSNPSTSAWSFDITFTQEGTTTYECDVHGPFMSGRVIVSSGGTQQDPGSLKFEDASYQVTEGGQVEARVRRTGGTDGAVSVQFTTANGSATLADYQAAGGVLNWGSGEGGLKTFAVQTTQDTADEPNETVSLSLFSPTGGATLGSPSAVTLTIVDDDEAPTVTPGTLRLAQDAYTVAEGAGNAQVTVQRVGGSDGQVKVDYTTGDGSAQSGLDYTETGGTLTFANGDSAAKTVNVPVIDDAEPEDAETFHVSLSNPTGGATLGRSSTTVTIEDDDTTFAPCEASETVLCLGEDGRFQVEVTWRTADERTGAGMSDPIGKRDSGLFYFFDPDNSELLFKVLNGCSITGHYWVFFAATTDVEFTIKVTDTEGGAQRTYTNDLGHAANAVTDTSAFETCP